MRVSTGFTAVFLIAAGFASPAHSAVPEAARPLLALRNAIEAAQSLDEVKASAGPLLTALGATARVTETHWGPALRLTFQAPVSARKLSTSMGWSQPFAVSAGTDFLSWSLEIRRQDWVDFYHRPRTRTAIPRLGRWALRTELIKKPSGEPASSDGYDLTRSGAEVRSIEVSPWSPEFDPVAWLATMKPNPDAPRVDVVATPQTYSGPCPVDVKFTGTLRGAAPGSRWEARWEQSDGTWTDIQRIAITSLAQKITTTRRLGAPHQRLQVWQKLRAAPVDLVSEPAQVTIACE
jgi:hypothetical protein